MADARVRKTRRLLYGPRFDGARELDRFLRETNTSVGEFCDGHGIDRWVLERLLNGRAQRTPEADLVIRLDQATGGRVHLAMWAMSTLREDKPDEVPETKWAPGCGPNAKSCPSSTGTDG